MPVLVRLHNLVGLPYAGAYDAYRVFECDPFNRCIQKLSDKIKGVLGKLRVA